MTKRWGFQSHLSLTWVENKKEQESIVEKLSRSPEISLGREQAILASHYNPHACACRLTHWVIRVHHSSLKRWMRNFGLNVSENKSISFQRSFLNISEFMLCQQDFLFSAPFSGILIGILLDVHLYCLQGLCLNYMFLNRLP